MGILEGVWESDMSEKPEKKKPIDIAQEEEPDDNPYVGDMEDHCGDS